MLRWILAPLLGMIVACAASSGGGETRPTLPSTTAGHSGVETFEEQNSLAPQLAPKINTTGEVGKTQVSTSGRMSPVGGHDTLTPEATSRTLAEGAPTVETEPQDSPAVTLGGVHFRVEVAVTSQERIQGLSGHAPLAADEGMLFVFEKAQMYSFWMREVLFPLDMVWIDAECTVAHITRNAPHQAPDQSLSDLPRYGPPVPVLYVLEINAGEAESAAVAVGSPVRFTGSLAGVYGC